MNALKRSIHSAARKSGAMAKALAEAKYLMMPLQKKNTKKLDRVIGSYVPEERRSDRTYLKRLKKDLFACDYAYSCSYYEYFVFDFEHRTKEERREFVTEAEFLPICNRVAAKGHTERLFRDKYQAYQTFQPYYKRDCIKVTGETDRDRFYEFAASHPRFIVKALDKSRGRDNYVFDLEDAEQTTEEIFALMLSVGMCIVEELIEQAEEMKRFHPSSVNTIRFVTLLQDGGVRPLFALVRMGCGEAHIDNVSAGGLFAVIDVDSGVIVTPGIRRVGSKLTEFDVHPDSGVPIKGTAVPRWEEARKLAETLALLVPEQPYVGWDLALTEDGWVVVEGNHKPSLTSIQIALGHGVRPWLALFEG